MKLKKNIFLLFFGIAVFIFTFLITSNNILGINPLVYSNNFDERDAHIYSGVKLTVEEGLFSFGGFSSGFIPKDFNLNAQNIENNYYLILTDLNKYYLDNNIDKNFLLQENDIEIFAKEPFIFSRFVPYLFYKLNIFGIQPSVFIENIYYIISALTFSTLAIKFKTLFNFNVAFIFTFMSFTFPLFIMQLRSLAIPYLIGVSPLIFGMFIKETDLLNKISVFKLSFIFLIPFLNGIVSGYTVILSYLTGCFLVHGYSKTKNFIIKNIFPLISSFILSVFLSQIVIVLQSALFNNVNISKSILLQLNSFLKRYKSEIYISGGEIGLSSVIKDSCIETKVFENILNYLNVKLIDLIYIEITLSMLILLATFVLFIQLIFLNQKKLTEYYMFLIFSFLTTMSWIIITNGHSACHLHFQPKLFIYSLLPIFYVYLGLFIDFIFLKIKDVITKTNI